VSSAPPSPMVVRTGAPLDAPRPSLSPAMASTMDGSTTMQLAPRLLDMRPRRACVVFPLLPPPSPLTWWRSHSYHQVLHVDEAWSTTTAPRAVFSTALAATVLPLHRTRAPLASYHSSPPGRPWPPMTSCFKCFKRMFQVFHLDVAEVYLDVA